MLFLFGIAEDRHLAGYGDFTGSPALRPEGHTLAERLPAACLVLPAAGPRQYLAGSSAARISWHKLLSKTEVGDSYSIADMAITQAPEEQLEGKARLHSASARLAFPGPSCCTAGC